MTKTPCTYESDKIPSTKRNIELVEQSYLISSPFAIYGPTITVTQLSNFINLGVSCFLQEHLRWRNHPWRLTYQGPYLYYFWIYGVLAFIWNDFSPTKTWGSSNSFGYSFWTILPFENPFGCQKIPNKLAHQVNQTKQAKQTHQPTRPTRTIRCNRPTRPTRTIKPALKIFS